MSDSKNDEEKPKSDLSFLEEDKEFEEFPAEKNSVDVTKGRSGWLVRLYVNPYHCIKTFGDWTDKDEDDKDINVWEDNWNDDNVEDEFNDTLRAEIKERNAKLELEEQNAKPDLEEHNAKPQK
ncbi:26S proteasome complex subunit SEM1-like isoform X2 [Macrosteles quadrilineatus]|uniref:26S proteasome complex subunit SEM1-like isoform X2 n=1 Tax=Macrosteles quadrilineatus TaxID=74068 RepID=UPI0023E2D725|nr:26S proteasome complex subunit SEM1-like isoform X2 [Macrosteles quadrilineatus]